MKKFCLIVIALAVCVGCDEGKKIVSPVMDDIQEPVAETPAVEDEAVPYPELIFDPQIPDPPVIPAGLDILKSDRVSHKNDADFHRDYADDIFDDAKTALESESLKEFLSWAEEFLAEYCGTNERGVYWALELFFTTRQARKDFIDLLPGGAYVWGHLDLPDDKFITLQEVPLPEDALLNVWWTATPKLVVVADTAYYGIEVNVNTDHKECTPPGL